MRSSIVFVVSMIGCIAASPSRHGHGGEGGRKGNERAQGRLGEAEARPHAARPSLAEDEHGHRGDQRHREHGAERCQEADVHGQ